MKKEDCFYLGIITKPFGYKGELVCYFDVDDPYYYENLDSVLIDLGKELVPFLIESIRLNNNHAYIVFQDVKADAALTLIKKELYLPLQRLPKLKGNKFYFHEVLGFEVIDSIKGNIGKIEKIMDHPAQPILQILHANGKEILIPIAEDIIINVDRKNKQISLQAPEGLIDLYLE
ncbi:MAG: ribosome maturation factor RimM [Bacteroidetes bacterium]|nr:ribosome maturation factor RimM [Bacteroidota bacterium]